jgi:hypothetical protein
MGDSLDHLAYLVNLMEVRDQQACFHNHIQLVICDICSSKFHGNDTCPMLLDTKVCGETQIVGDHKIHILRSNLFGHINNFNKMYHWKLTHNHIWRKLSNKWLKIISKWLKII